MNPLARVATRCAPVIAVGLSVQPALLALAASESPAPARPAATAEPSARVRSQWTFLGLGNRFVTKLRLHDDLLYACTDGGVWVKAVSSTDTLWTALGLADRQVQALWIASPDTLLAGAAVPVGDSVSLHRTTDGGASWHSYQNGFGAGRYPEVADLEGLGEPGGLLAVAASIEKSTNGGAEWRRVAEQCVLNFVRRNPAAAGHFWAGGETCIFWPIMLRSTDAGESWRLMALEAGGDNACDAVAFHPSDPQVVYTGMEGRIQRTLDGGDHWEEVTSPNPTLYFNGIAIRPRLPLRLYAAGASGPPDPRGLVLYTSDDAGVSWTPHSELVALRYGVFDLLLVEREGQDWLFIATDRGVHRWSDESTAIMPGTWSQTKRFYRPAASPRSH